MSKASEWAKKFDDAEQRAANLKAERPWFGLRLHRLIVTDDGTLKIEAEGTAKEFTSQEALEVGRWLLDMFEE